MQDLNIEKFSPKKAELMSLADTYRQLEIKGTDDKDGYAAVDAARKDLKKNRVQIQKQGKELRDEALKFQKAVIAAEKELVSLIEPVEKELAEKQEKIDQEIEKQKRLDQLPFRQEKLASIGFTFEDATVLAMDDVQFAEFFNAKHAEKIAADQKKIEEEKAKLAAEAARLEEERRLEKVRKEAEEEAARKAKIEAEAAAARAEAALKEAQEKAEREKIEATERAEKEKQAAVEAERKRADAEKQALIDEQNRKEKERIAAEEAAKKAEADKKAKEEAEKQEAEKKAKVKKFMEKHGCTIENRDQFRTEFDEDGNLNLWQLVGTLKI